MIKQNKGQLIKERKELRNCTKYILVKNSKSTTNDKIWNLIHNKVIKCYTIINCIQICESNNNNNKNSFQRTKFEKW